jgi:hypothetical protein
MAMVASISFLPLALDVIDLRELDFRLGLAFLER